MASLNDLHKNRTIPPKFQSISLDNEPSYYEKTVEKNKKNRMKGQVTTAASTALFNAIISDHIPDSHDRRTVDHSEVRALLASGSRLTNAEIASIKKIKTSLEKTANEEFAACDHGWAWKNVAEAETLQEGLDLLSAASARSC